jgi:hypothetical protein
MSLICFVASFDEISVVFLLVAALRVQTMAPERTREVLSKFDKCGLPNVKTKRATPFYSVKKLSGKNSSGTQSNGRTSRNDADFCAVIFFQTERKTVKPMLKRHKSIICKNFRVVGGSKAFFALFVLA